ncbi:MAG TPA: hypothetical protein EYO50_06625 [Candidatus Marinimicrobia bacterium]|nr:hypothetical protein [Candidatus Neomarinimicrobiota bacterium]
MRLKAFFLIIVMVISLNDMSIAATRVAYTRPGLMMKIPFSTVGRSPYLFRTGFGTELHNFSPFNSTAGIFFDMEVGRNFSLGFSSVQTADTTNLANLDVSTYAPPVEFGFHLQQRVFTYNDVSVSVGLQDIVFQNSESESGLNLSPEQLSFFVVVSSAKQLGSYNLQTFLGFGTGGFGAQDSLLTTDSSLDTLQSGAPAGVFAGFHLNTPFFNKWGGLDFVGEFDGIGINVGLRIPLTSDYRLNIGFTHIDKLPSWKIRYWPGHPALTVGFDMAVPRRAKRVIGGLAGPYPLMTEAGDLPVFDDQFSDQFDSTLAMASFMVSSLRDSVVMVNNEMRNLMVRLSAMEQKSNFLEDSLKSLKLSSNVEGKNMNEAMRHLSRSLRYFYGGDYRASLQEVESALDLNPNLALAYARRGSIYYKLGDVQRATINWNLALRMDPEYDDVRNILKALHENRLRTTSFVRE